MCDTFVSFVAFFWHLCYNNTKVLYKLQPSPFYSTIVDVAPLCIRVLFAFFCLGVVVLFRGDILSLPHTTSASLVSEARDWCDEALRCDTLFIFLCLCLEVIW